MSKPACIRFFVGLALLGGLFFVGFRIKNGDDVAARPIDRADLLRRAVHIPAGNYAVGSREPGCYPPDRKVLSDFYIWPVEVPRSWWTNQTDPMPVTSVSHDEAVAFCARLSEQFGLIVRLPTIDEWQVAARAGTPGVPYPWGWASPEGRAVFDTSNAVPVASLESNPWRLYDMAGNVAEWCLADASSATAPALGGSWAERNPAYIRVSHKLDLPKNYRDTDVGFRFVIEPLSGGAGLPRP